MNQGQSVQNVFVLPQNSSFVTATCNAFIARHWTFKVGLAAHLIMLDFLYEITKGKQKINVLISLGTSKVRISK